MPEARAAEVCEPGAELKPQPSEQPKDEIAVGGRVRHDLLDFEACFVLEQGAALLEKGIRIAASCSCTKGCPNCIVPAPLPRRLGQEGWYLTGPVTACRDRE